MGSYQSENIHESLMAQALFGGIAFKGKIPVKSHPQFGLHTGYNTLPGRMAYNIPEYVKMNSDSLNKIEEIVEEAISDRATPGCQILVARKGIVVYNKSFGYHTYRKKQSVQHNDKYDIASLTKIFATTLAVMKLYEEEAIKLDTAISAYLPYLDTTNKKDITLTDIMTHRAMLPPWIPFYISTLEGLYPEKEITVKINDEIKHYKGDMILVATGASENMVAFDGWTKPGVIGAGAAQTMMNLYYIKPGNRILMLGSGNVGLVVSYQLLQAGCEVAALVDAAPRIGGYGVHAAKIARCGVPFFLSHTILQGYITTAIAAAGLELYGGFLHSDKSGKPSLALDMLEEFRQPIIDRFVIRIVQKGIIKKDDFDNSLHGFRLKDAPRKLFYKELRKEILGGDTSEELFGKNNFKTEKNRSQKGHLKLNYKREMIHQARKLANFLIGTTSEYKPFISNW